MEVDDSNLGYEIASKETGLALVRPDEPLKGRTTFRLTIRPVAGFPSNGFLAFGEDYQYSRTKE